MFLPGYSVSARTFRTFKIGERTCRGAPHGRSRCTPRRRWGSSYLGREKPGQGAARRGLPRPARSTDIKPPCRNIIKRKPHIYRLTNVRFLVLSWFYSPGCPAHPVLVNEPAEARRTAEAAARRAEGGVRLLARGGFPAAEGGVRLLSPGTARRPVTGRKKERPLCLQFCSFPLLPSHPF